MAIILTKELLTSEPKGIAKSLVYAASNDSKTTKTQIRKFYNDFLVLKNKSDFSRDEEYFKNNVLPLIYFSKAKLAYSYGKQNISKEFVEKINSYIDKIETKSDFNNFLKFYEALIGFLTYYAVKTDENKSNNRK